MAGVVSAGGTKQIQSGLINPLQLPGLQLWLDGADPLGTGTAPANGTIISTWSDKSGLGRNGTGVGSPAYVSASRNISFNGSQYYTVPYSGAHPIETAFVVANVTNPNTAAQTLIGGNGSGAVRWLFSYFNNIYLQATAVANDAQTTTTLPVATNVIYGHAYNATASLVYQTGAVGSTASAAVNNFVSDNGTLIGQSYAGTQGVTGSISEVLIYNQFFSTVQRQAIEGYLAWKWNIQTSLPAGHPYLTTAPTASAISSTFIPTYIPGIQIWLDGNDPAGTGVVPANGATITTWADKSGNAYNATTAAGTLTYSNGVSSGIAFTGTQFMTTALNSLAASESAFVVLKFNNLTGEQDILSWNYGGGAARGREYMLLSSQMAWDSTNAAIYYSTAPSANVTSLVEYTYTTSVLNMYLNGSNTSSNTAISFSPGSQGTVIGSYNSGGYLNATLNEIVVYNSVITSAQRQVVEGYLAWKWNIQSNLSSNHPFRYSAPTSLSVTGLTNYNYSTSYLPGLQAWYDAADPLGTGVQPANNTVISTWVDKAGESLNPMIASGSPTYTTGSQNSLPGITISGNSGTNITNYYQAFIPSGTFLAELDAFVVYKNVSAVTYNAIISRSSASVLYNAPLDIYEAAIFAGAYPGSYVQTASSFNAYNTSTSIFNVTLSQNTAASSRVTSYRNGAAATLTGTSTGWTPGDTGTHLYLGTRGDKATGFNGVFYEVMVFNAPLTPGGRQYVEGYLAWKWGLQASLPSTHPYYVAAPSITNLSFNPSQIFGLNLWLDGADPLNTGILPANGATITTWFDKSPNAFSVASVGSPTYALATRNITMNGTNQGFNYTYAGAHPTETGFFVLNMTTPNSFQVFMTSPPSYARQFYDYYTALVFGQQNIGTNATTTSTITANSNTLLGYSANSTTSFFYFNGTAGPTGTGLVSPPVESTIYIGYAGGGGLYLAGTLSEVIIFNTVLTTAERQVMEGYLAWKWGTQVSLPATHPYKNIQPSLLTFIPSFTTTANISQMASSFLPLQSNTIDYGNTGQTVGSNGSLSFSTVLGKSCVFINGSTANYVSIPIANNNVFTVAFWFNYTNTQYFTVASYTTPAGAMAMQFDLVSAGSNTVYTALPTQWTNTPGSANLGANTWNFIAVTVNQNTYVENVYMNGALASTATGTGVFPSSPSLFVLGKSGDGTVFPSGGTRSYQGYIQNFMYFDTILTGAQIATIYEQTAQDLATASQPTSLSLTLASPTLTFSWTAGTNTTSYVVTFYGVATNTNVGGLFLASFTTTSTSQTYNPGVYTYYYASVTPTNSGFLGTTATSSAIQGPPSPATSVTMGSFAAQQTTISASWTAGAGATSYTVNFLSNAANSTSGGTVWQTFTGVTGTSQTSSTTLRSGASGTYYYATVTAVSSGGSAAAATSSGTVQYYIPLWIGTLSYWFDASDTASITASGNTITTWTNKGNASAGNATTGGGTVTTNSTTLNSRNTVRLNANSWLITPNYTAPSFTCSFFTTFRAATAFPSQSGYFFCFNNSSGRDFFLYYIPTNSVATRYFVGFNVLGGEFDYSFNGTVTATNTFQTASLISVVTSNTTTTAPQGMWWNGSNFPTVSRTGAANTTATYNTFAIGAYNRPTDSVAYDMGDFLLFPSVLSTTNRQIVEGWLAWKWGLQGSLIAGHPYASASP
jgi:hypothetical protein